MGNKFTIETDKKSLSELLSQVVQTCDHHYYLRKLLDYDYGFVYKPRKDNSAIDALSRVDVENIPHCIILLIPSLDVVKQLKLENDTLTDLHDLHLELASNGASYSNLKCINGILYKDGKIFLSQLSPLKFTLLEKFHSIPTCAHAGVSKTYNRMNGNFTWKGIERDLMDFFSRRKVCQQIKYLHTRPTRLLQVIEPPSQVQEDIAMDFIVSLPFLMDSYNAGY